MPTVSIELFSAVHDTQRVSLQIPLNKVQAQFQHVQMEYGLHVSPSQQDVAAPFWSQPLTRIVECDHDMDIRQIKVKQITKV